MRIFLRFILIILKIKKKIIWNIYINQHFVDYEIIAINDGSNDKKSEILNFFKFNNGIKVITQNNKGLGAT